MNFRKKLNGNPIDNDYVWTAIRKKHKITINFDKMNYIYWFEIVKDKDVVFNSLENKLTYDSLDDAMRSIETWVDINISGKLPQKAQLSRYRRYTVLVDSIKDICKKYPDSEVTSELKVLLKRVWED